MLQDPEIMEVLTFLIGGEKGGMGGGDGPESPYVPPAPTPAAAPAASKPAAAPPAAAPSTPGAAAKERGNALYKAKQFPEAIAAYDEAISLEPTNISFLNNKAAVYIEMGDCDRALELCAEAVAVGRAK